VIDIDLNEGDILDIYDGESREGSKIVSYMGSRQGDVLFTTRDSAFIHLTTDLTDSGKGFNLTYQSGNGVSL